MEFPAIYDLEFITPTFLGGADPKKAEFRAPTIRGQLRWWFRVLADGLPSSELPGGVSEAEKRVFGGVHGNDKEPFASAIQLRIRETKRLSNSADLPKMRIEEPLYYLYYFAKVSGSVSNKVDGPRIQPGAFFSPGSACQIHVALCRPINTADRKLLGRAVDAFIHLGSLGLRSTRGCGAFVCKQATFKNQAEIAAWAKGLRNTEIRLLEGETDKTWQKAQTTQAEFIKDFRFDNHLSGRSETALGSASPRLASALHLRPVKLIDGTILPIVYYTDSTNPKNIPSIEEKVIGQTCLL